MRKPPSLTPQLPAAIGKDPLSDRYLLEGMSGGNTRQTINGRMTAALLELLDAGETGRRAPENNRALMALRQKEMARLDWIPDEDDPSSARPRWTATDSGAAYIGRQAIITR